ncbi:MAG: uL14 family ribosomal protein [Candidatus Rehaiarchaeum fermentans]|nr:uL14 family ribosomal protein [Candidatus Rehaiarchaeum fermentans]
MGTGRKGSGIAPLGARVPKAINFSSEIVVADNSGAQIARVISVRGYHGVKGRQPKCGIGDIVKIVVKKGSPDTKSKVYDAVIVRQKKAFRRANGMHVMFEDNACVIIKDLKKFEPLGTIIKGPIPKEVANRFQNIGRIASVII